jgi:hypothetical protein
MALVHQRVIIPGSRPLAAPCSVNRSTPTQNRTHVRVLNIDIGDMHGWLYQHAGFLKNQHHRKAQTSKSWRLLPARMSRFCATDSRPRRHAFYCPKLMARLHTVVNICEVEMLFGEVHIDRHVLRTCRTFLPVRDRSA